MKYRKKPVVITAERTQIEQDIETLEGTMHASVGDYIITGINGEKYPCKPDIFEKTYENVEETMEAGGVDFGTAIKLMKCGTKMFREHWNGKNMFVVYQKGYPDGIPCNKNTAEAWGMNEGDKFVCNPYLQIKQIDGSHSMWVPSIGDVLADDWCIFMTEDEAREAGVLNGQMWQQ